MMPWKPLFMSLLAHLKQAKLEKIKGLLLYEDQKEKICESHDCWNALTLKKKIYDTEKTMEDFTFCFRINLLSYRGKAKRHKLITAKTNKYVLNKDTNNFWTTGLSYELFPVDGPGNGVITVQTFNDRLQEVIATDGLYTIWPIYETEVNANQWNSFCIGSNLQSRTIFLARNGKVLHNFTQPELWADLNIGLDTSILEPLQVIREIKGTPTSRLFFRLRSWELSRVSNSGETLGMESTWEKTWWVWMDTLLTSSGLDEVFQNKN